MIASKVLFYSTSVIFSKVFCLDYFLCSGLIILSVLLLLLPMTNLFPAELDNLVSHDLLFWDAVSTAHKDSYNCLSESMNMQQLIYLYIFLIHGIKVKRPSQGRT